MLIVNFSPFPNLKTGGLILRQLTIEDENEIFLLRSDESINKYVDRPKPSRQSLVNIISPLDDLFNKGKIEW